MREIKFRAWLPSIKKMYSSEDLAWQQISLNPHNGQFQQEDHSQAALIPLQYTGLKDKNGTEIYEGDIVNYRPNPTYHDAYYEVKYGVYMTSSDFYASPAYGFYLSSRREEEREMAFNPHWVNDIIGVIGNIWENPNLLGSA